MLHSGLHLPSTNRCWVFWFWTWQVSQKSEGYQCSRYWRKQSEDIVNPGDLILLERGVDVGVCLKEHPYPQIIHMRWNFNGCYTIQDRVKILLSSLFIMVDKKPIVNVSHRTSTALRSPASSFMVRYTVAISLQFAATSVPLINGEFPYVTAHTRNLPW